MASVDFGTKNLPYDAGYPTPASLPDTKVCRVFRIPADETNASWLATFMGLMMYLTFAENWVQQDGGLTEDECATVWLEMMDCAYEDAEVLDCPVSTVEAPYWDTPIDSDDNADLSDQPWYGLLTVT